MEYYYFPIEYGFYKRITQESFGSHVADTMRKMEYERKRLVERQEQFITIINKKKWLFPFAKIPQRSSVVLYGAGQVGQDYYKQITDSGYCKVVLWMDKQFENNQLNKAPCGWIEDLKCCQYDCILIALNNQMLIEEVCTFLIGQNVPKEKIVF